MYPSSQKLQSTSSFAVLSTDILRAINEFTCIKNLLNCTKTLSYEKKILYGSNKILKQVGWQSNFNIKKSFIDIFR